MIGVSCSHVGRGLGGLVSCPGAVRTLPGKVKIARTARSVANTHARFKVRPSFASARLLKNFFETFARFPLMKVDCSLVAKGFERFHGASVLFLHAGGRNALTKWIHGVNNPYRPRRNRGYEIGKVIGH